MSEPQVMFSEDDYLQLEEYYQECVRSGRIPALEDQHSDQQDLPLLDEQHTSLNCTSMGAQVSRHSSYRGPISNFLIQHRPHSALSPHSIPSATSTLAVPETNGDYHDYRPQSPAFHEHHGPSSHHDNYTDVNSHLAFVSTSRVEPSSGFQYDATCSTFGRDQATTHYTPHFHGAVDESATGVSFAQTDIYTERRYPQHPTPNFQSQTLDGGMLSPIKNTSLPPAYVSQPLPSKMCLPAGGSENVPVAGPSMTRGGIRRARKRAARRGPYDRDNASTAHDAAPAALLVVPQNYPAHWIQPGDIRSCPDALPQLTCKLPSNSWSHGRLDASRQEISPEALGALCAATFASSDDFVAHIAAVHGVVQHKNTNTRNCKCAWDGCSERDLLKPQGGYWRCVVEKHAGVKYACPIRGCKESSPRSQGLWQRNYKLKKHIREKHAGEYPAFLGGKFDYALFSLFYKKPESE